MMKNILIIITILITAHSCAYQKSTSSNEINTDNLEEDVFINENQTYPYPIGGIEAMKSKLRYPPLAIKNNIEGTVLIETWINSFGEVEKTQVFKGIDPQCDEEAMRIIKLTKFIPSKINGEAVNVIIKIPIIFKLQ